MAQGNFDENGIWIYGEDDVDSKASDMLNRLGRSVSAALSRQFEVLGSLRRGSDGKWAAMADSGHSSVGIASLSQTTTYVEIKHERTATRVLTFTVTPDDAFASKALRVGASVGLDVTRLFFYLGTSDAPVDPAALTTAGGNIWVHGVFKR